MLTASSVKYYLETETNLYHTILADGVPTKMNRSWMFVGFTYDPITQKPYAFLNNQYTEMPVGANYIQTEPEKSLWFGGHAPFLIDNIFYFPKFSTAEEISAIYEMSMLAFLIDILLTL